MAIENPIEITYGDSAIGGASAQYQIVGPYVLDKSYDSIRLVVDVVVVAEDVDTLQVACETLEGNFRKRLADGDTFVIRMDSKSWTYTVGETMLRARSSIAKSGNQDLDRAASRGYTITVEGELPADDSVDAGLRDIEVLVDFEAGRQKVVTMRGTYTATTAGDAKARYEADADTRCTSYLDVVDSEATFELVDETFTLDREGGSTPAAHLLNFTRQFVELLENQTQSQLDDGQIKDHRITFTNVNQYPGDSRDDVTRLQRVIGSYDCAVDIEQTTDLQAVYRSKVKTHIRQLFQSNFQPTVFGVEEERVSYDETAKRISVSFQFIFQPSGGEALVEMSQSVAFRETRSIDYTPTHSDDELAAFADVGFGVLERIWNRTAIAIGAEAPKLRIRERARQDGPVGRFNDNIRGQQGPDNRNTSEIEQSGWNVVASTSQVTPRIIGDPAGEQFITVTVLTETVTERYNAKPGNRTFVPIQRAPTTGSA
jgi:hypothetical protein